MPGYSRSKQILIQLAHEHFERNGFLQIGTPALEHAEILRGKGSSDHDKETFYFHDAGERPVGMRYDLTVPLARFIAQHRHDLPNPARLFQYGPVWRGERPQRGRYREFWQCDFDIIGDDSEESDAEVISIVASILNQLAPSEFQVHFSDRRISQALITELVGAEAPINVYLRIVDKLPKIGREASLNLLQEAGSSYNTACQIIDALTDDQFQSMNYEDWESTDLWKIVSRVPSGQIGLTCMRHILDFLRSKEIDRSSFIFDPSIVRGLDYYTGMVFETFSVSQPEIGSVSSGGRYNNLIAAFSKEPASGVGGSLGIDRLIDLLHGSKVLTGAPLVAIGGEASRDKIMTVADSLRKMDCNVYVIPGSVRGKKYRRTAERATATALLEIHPDGSIWGGTLSEPGSLIQDIRDFVSKVRSES